MRHNDVFPERGLRQRICRPMPGMWAGSSLMPPGSRRSGAPCSNGRTPGKVRFVAAPVDAAGLGGLIDLISEKKLIGWFVSQVMKASQGKANPGLVNRILKQKLS